MEPEWNPNGSQNGIQMPKLASKFNCLVGYSDHSIGHDAATVSASLGGAIIEKHFTIDNNSKDESFLMYHLEDIKIRNSIIIQRYL